MAQCEDGQVGDDMKLAVGVALMCLPLAILLGVALWVMGPGVFVVLGVILAMSAMFFIGAGMVINR